MTCAFDPSCSLEGKGKDTMPSDFWDHLKEQLSAVPPDFSCALELLKEIKEVSGPWSHADGRFQGLRGRRLEATNPDCQGDLGRSH